MSAASQQPDSHEDVSLGRMAHDLKNLIGIILGFTELLLSEMKANDPRREDLLEIHRAGQAVLTVAVRMSEMARARDGK